MKLLALIYFSSALLMMASCSKKGIQEPLPQKTNVNLQYFGYTLVDVGWDDPTDSEVKTNYIDEVHEFSNVADILVIDPSENIVSRMSTFDQHDVQAVLHLSEIFFEQKNEGGDKSGYIYGLRSDYQQRWDTFVATNDINANAYLINCFYIGEEPSWNGIPESEFTLACDYAKSTVPQVPIFNVESFADIDNLYTPNSVDWVGFDHYFLREPSKDPAFIQEFNTLKSKMKSHQKVLLIMDGHWIKLLHGTSGISKNDMDFIARDYYELANSDTTIIGILGYFWPSGFDVKKSIGTRNLPDHVLEEHQQIGRTITGK